MGGFSVYKFTLIRSILTPEQTFCIIKIAQMNEIEVIA